MASSKKLPITQILQRRRIQLIFTFLLLIFSLFILLNFSITPITETTSSTVIPSATAHLLSASNYISSLSSIPRSTAIEDELSSGFSPNPTEIGSYFAKKITSLSILRKTEDDFIRKKGISSCDIFDGKWVLDDSDPVYPPGSCPFLNYTFNCFNSGRSDLGYLRYRWQPHHCDIPRFNGKKMLEMLRGKRMVFVGDSLNRNMWESLVCSLRKSLIDKKKVFEVSGKRQFRTEGFYSFKFEDYSSTIEFIRSPFLVQEWKVPSVKGFKARRELLRLDVIQATTSIYHNADYLIFNTGNWWTHNKTRKGKDFFQEGEIVRSKLHVTEAYTKALKTWANWVDKNVNKNKTKVFFAGYSASHFRRAVEFRRKCDGETEPITDDKYLAAYPWMMKALESVISKMKTPVMYLNVTKMTDYRKDGHPSIYRLPESERRPGMTQDCSHWCLPGVLDSWNQLIYVFLLRSSKRSHKSH